MTDLYLIAHKVRGEAAFDVAIRMECPECHGEGHHTRDNNGNVWWHPCTECDSLGYWWIIPTSGHRAYPYSTMGLFNGIPTEVWRNEIGEMPPDLPDHYTTRAEPKVDLLARLNLQAPPAPTLPPIKRRF